MVSDGLTVLQAAVQIGAAALYLWVARIVFRRDLEGAAKRANAMFGVWWLSYGLVFMLAPLLTLPPRVFGYENLAFSVALLNALLLMLAVAVWGLVYYLTFLYTGSARAFWPMAVFYAFIGFALLFVVSYINPTGFDETGALTYQHRQLPAGPGIVLGLVFSLPVVIAAIGYGTLYFRVHDSRAKYRIGLVSGAFVLQFGWGALSSVLQLSSRYPDSTLLAFVSTGLAAVAAVAVLLAFRPPRMVRRRIGFEEPEGA